MLIDRFGRQIDYLRVSVTDRCDLRCQYCIPKGFKNFGTPKDWLNFDELLQIVRVFHKLGVKHFRLTGGEPLLRKGIDELISRIRALDPNIDLSMTTNGTQLTKYAQILKQAGLNRLNVSLDSLRRDCIQQITGNDCLEKVLDGLEAAKIAGFETTKINMVPITGLNDNDISQIIEYCIANGFVLRLIESMPMGSTGRASKGRNLSELLAEWTQTYQLKEITQSLGSGPAKYWQSQDQKFTLGLITPISQHFCASCNRVRLSVDGTLYMCLGQNADYPLRSLVREGCSDEQLAQAIKDAIELKPEKHDFTIAPSKINRLMSMTGG